MDYQKEYDEYWSRPDRWGSHSFRDPETLAAQIASISPRGKILDVGFGMGLLVKTLLARGWDAHGMDIAERVVNEANRFAPGRFTVGSLLAPPFPDESFQTVVSTDCLEHIAESDVPRALAELHRVTRRHLFIQLATTPDRDKRWHLTIHDRTWWEQQFFQAGFRKHPALQTIVPYESLERDHWQVTLVFEKIPSAILGKFPLASLKPERDLHMDMLREAGRRSDAHIARYMLAKRYLPAEGLVLDAACGLGYGSAVLAQGAPAVRIIGIDSSAFAVDYARANFSGMFPNVEFHEGDVNKLENIADESVSLVVSFETIEHLREPELFLREVGRVLKPGGVLLSSVPNLWVDDTGKDPNPNHFHIFDFPKLAALSRKFFALKDVYRQTAGGGIKLPNAQREMRRVNLPVTAEVNHAEWWLVAAQKECGSRFFPLAPIGGEGRSEGAAAFTPNSFSAQKGGIILLTSDPTHPLYTGWIPSLSLPWKALDPAHAKLDLLRGADLIITHDTYIDPGRKLVKEAVAAGIPTLILADGILEYRNTWEHPQIEPGAIFQPVLGHKIACLGRSHARILESWGNAGKCEIIGSPRLDHYCELQRRHKRADEPFRILVMTALTPWFNESQHQAVRAALRDLKEFFSEQQTIGPFGLQAVWRLTKGLDAEIGLAPESSPMDFSGKQLADILQQVDAVITTPSTSMLEAMLLGLPVAVLDYTNSPLYMEAAWRITARAHVAPVIAGLMRPPAPKMLFQETALHDALECATPAASRLLRLIREMVACVRHAREGNSPIVFPDRILEPETNRHAIRENLFRIEQLYNPAYELSEPSAKISDREPSRLAARKPMSEMQLDLDFEPSNKLRAATTRGPNTAQLSQKGKLLFISHDASRSGAPMLLLNVIRAIRETHDWDIRIVLRAGGPLESEFQQLGETVVCPSTEKVLQARRFEDVSLIYSNTCTNGMLLRSLPPDGPPVLTHIHELSFAIESFGAENFAEVRKHTTHFIACSEAVAESLRVTRQIPAEKISVIYAGIPVNSVRENALTQSSADARRWCGLAEDVFLVAACGFADWRKGPDLFLQLADYLRRRKDVRRKISFVWVGRLPAEGQGRILLHDLQRLGLGDSVKFIGEQLNPYPFLNACDLFCSCSREDPFPLVVLEAAALGKPTVCFADSGGATEFCARGGGLVAPYLNIEAMGETVLRLISDESLRAETGRAAAHLVDESHNLRNFTPHIAQLIEKFSCAPKPKLAPPPPTFGKRVRDFGRTLLTRRV